MRGNIKKPTITDIAENAGVSRSTVSRVLSNPSMVSPAKKELVDRAIKDLSYRPSPIARGLVTGSFPAIHVLISDIRNPLYAETIRGVEDAARGSGYAVVFGNTDESVDREIQYLNHAREHRFAGTILMSAVGRIELKNALTELNRPFVLVYRALPGLQADTVLLNNELGAFQATQYLIELGHTRICHLAGPKFSSASQERLHGFVKAMRSSGLEMPEGSIRQGDLRLETGERIGRRMIKEGLGHTAIFAANDLTAIGLISAFENEGLHVPDDISVIGFDDIIYSRLGRLQLSTVRQPSYDMGRAAMNMLLEQFRNESSAFRTLRFEPELVERTTCGPPKSLPNRS
jgi:LacI family transcriptional regulator, galactose operon repressor